MPLTTLKRAARPVIKLCAVAIGSTRFGRVLFEDAIETARTRTRSVAYRGTSLTFAVPSALSEARAQTFATKEPETLAWIDSIPEGSILWDVGANVGLYSCYAAKARHCRVIAFEPSVFNVELLARNVFINSLTDNVTILCLPLCEGLAESTLNLSNTAWGGALSSFGTAVGFDGHQMQKVFEFRTVGLSMDQCVSRLGLPPPRYLKMDVDGIEHLILRGGAETLRGIESISIEINDEFAAPAKECQQLLERAGLRFVSKAHSELIEDNPTFRSTFNQVWAR